MAARSVFSTSIAISVGLAVASGHAETVRIAIAGMAFQPAETSAKIGDTVELTVVRGGKQTTARATLIESPAPSS